MMRPTIKMLLAAMLTATPGLASAQAANRAAWLINVGVTRLAMVDKAEVTLAGQRLASAGVKSDPQWVPSLNVTRFVKFDVGLNLSTGLPRRSSIAARVFWRRRDRCSTSAMPHPRLRSSGLPCAPA